MRGEILNLNKSSYELEYGLLYYIHRKTYAI